MVTYVKMNLITRCKNIISAFCSDSLVRSRSHVYNGISIAFWHKSDLCHNGSTVTIYNKGIILFAKMEPTVSYSHPVSNSFIFISLFCVYLKSTCLTYPKYFWGVLPEIDSMWLIVRHNGG